MMNPGAVSTVKGMQKLLKHRQFSYIATKFAPLSYSIRREKLSLSCSKKHNFHSCLHTESTRFHHGAGWRPAQAFLVGTGIVGATAAWLWYNRQQAMCKRKAEVEPGAPIDKLPTYTSEDVSKHNSAATGIWVRIHDWPDELLSSSYIL